MRSGTLIFLAGCAGQCDLLACQEPPAPLTETLTVREYTHGEVGTSVLHNGARWLQDLGVRVVWVDGTAQATIRVSDTDDCAPSTGHVGHTGACGDIALCRWAIDLNMVDERAVAHELGHALGLPHVPAECQPGDEVCGPAVMNPDTSLPELGFTVVDGAAYAKLRTPSLSTFSQYCQDLRAHE
jgi:hypothetical protein